MQKGTGKFRERGCVRERRKKEDERKQEREKRSGDLVVAMPRDGS